MKVSKVLSIIQLSLMYISLILIIIAAIPFMASADVPEGLSLGLFIAGITCGSLALGVAIAIYVISFISIFKNNTVNHTQYVMINKIVAIPWFIGNFVLYALLIAGMLNPFLMMAIPVVIFLGVVITYLDMLSSTMINVGYLISAWRNKILKPNALSIIGVILEFIFCVDFLGAIFVFIDNKKQIN